jgi:archaellum biogenesis ATPase FlaH
MDSGIPGLDELMGGGISAGEAAVILGPSGAGKTIFGLRFAAHGLTQGELPAKPPHSARPPRPPEESPSCSTT